MVRNPLYPLLQVLVAADSNCAADALAAALRAEGVLCLRWTPAASVGDLDEDARQRLQRRVRNPHALDPRRLAREIVRASPVVVVTLASAGHAAFDGTWSARVLRSARNNF